MKLIKNLLLQIIITSILVVVGYGVGFYVSQREIFNSKEMNLNTRTNNGYIDNSISQIQFADIYGLLDGTAKKYGLALIKPQANKVEILLKFDNIPSVVNINNANKSLDTEYRMNTVKICCNGLDYASINSNEVKISLINQNNILSGKYSTILDTNLDQVDRLLFYGATDNSYKIVKDDVKDWPSNTLNKPAPFFWINLK